MANKKITVVGDGADELLSPEEEHRIEEKIDAMLDVSLPDGTSPAPAEPQSAVVPPKPIAETTTAVPEPPAPEQPKPEPKKVTKIVTRFADDEEDEAVAPAPVDDAKPVEPVDAPEPEPEPVPVVEKPKPVAKKIVIRHHDDDVPEEKPVVPAAEEPKDKAAEPEAPKPAKTSKTKAAGKKSKKAKTADAKPAKDDKDDLSAQLDAIAASALAAEEMIGTKAPEEPVPDIVPQEEPESTTDSPDVATEPAEPANTPESPDEPTETAEEAEPLEEPSDGAPPLIVKHSKAPINVTDNSEPLEAAEPAELPAKAPVAKTIAITDATDETEQPETTEMAEEPEVAAEEPETEADEEPEVTEIAVDEPEEPAEEIPVDVEPDTTESTEPAPEIAPAASAPTADDSSDKKYQPPAGPIQFKRAEQPIQPRKPGEPRPVEQVDELSEDAALAQAFETPKEARKPVAARQLAGKSLKILKWVLLVAVIAAVISIGVVPSLRHRALRLVGLGNTSTKVATPTTKTPAATKPTPVAADMSPDIYISKRDGIFNTYKIGPGSQPEKLVLAGTGNETEKIALAPSADSSFAALVSTRDAKRNSAGALQQSVNLISTSDGKATVTDTADQIKLIDWFGTRLVYVLLNTSTSTSDPDRYQIVSYDTASKTRLVLDHMNYLNEVLAAKGLVYYATATGPSGPGQFTSIRPDGNQKQVILTGEIAAITRTSYNDAVLSGVNKWYSYHFGDKQATPTNNVSQKGRLYIDSPDGKRSVYLNTTGSVPQLVVTDTATSKETTTGIAGAAYPLHWLSNDTIVYRNSGADYSLKVTGGKPTKLVDVFNAAGISLWHEQ
jgi:hypothetical protein